MKRGPGQANGRHVRRHRRHPSLMQTLASTSCRFRLLLASMASNFSRRTFLGTTAAVATAAGTGGESAAATKSWAAVPPSGFQRLSLPGRVVKVSKPGCLQSNQAYPKKAAARAMLHRALQELTGKSTVAEAIRTLVHPNDIVAIKPNGIAGRKTMKMATPKELVVEVVHAVMLAGVPAKNITIFEQYRDFLYATRCITDKATLALHNDFPAGVQTAVHLNSDAVMPAIRVGSVDTKYVRTFTDATAVINLCQVKDHSICGYTGAMKNITHGCNINPHDFHAHQASPQIAHLYAQDVVKSRCVLHIADAYQVIYDGGPIDTNPKRRVPYEALYVATDPVALDVVGWEVVEKLRRDNGLGTLKADGREPSYLRVASQLGLGVFDRKHIREHNVQA
jgi:uncharacterized protein (DUF362 family)